MKKTSRIKRLKISICAFMSVLCAWAGVFFATNTLSSTQDAITATALTFKDRTYTGKAYTPLTSDVSVFTSNVTAATGGGLDIGGSMGLNVPLDGAGVGLDITVNLPSKQSVANGGDGIDSWMTLSFTSAPATSMNTIPSFYGESAMSGYFLQISNVSSNSAPNCMSVSLEMKNGGTATPETIIPTFYVNGAIGKRITVSFKHTGEGKYSLSILDTQGNKIASMSNIVINHQEAFRDFDDPTTSPDFIYGETYVSTAIYTAQSQAKYATIHSVMKAKADVMPEEIKLTAPASGYEYVAGKKCEPTVDIIIQDGNNTELPDNEYTKTFINSDKIGTAKVKIEVTAGNFAGCVVEKEYVIKQTVPVKFMVDGVEMAGQSSTTAYAQSSITKTLPTIPDKEGYITVGWVVNNRLYKSGASVTLDITTADEFTFHALYMEFNTEKGASVRLVDTPTSDNPNGLRFRSYFSKDAYDALVACQSNGVVIQVGATITSAGSKQNRPIVGDLNKLYADSANQYMWMNTVLASIKTTNYERTYYSTPYITITYSDNATETFTVQPNLEEDGRTYEGVLRRAYNDTVTEKDEGMGYIYEVTKNGETAYSKFTADIFALLEAEYDKVKSAIAEGAQ